jgi:DUF1680 family protein
METNYPWEGRVKLTVSPAKPVAYALHLRIPGWAKNDPAPGGLYGFKASGTSTPIEVLLNGKPISYREEKGYAVISRTWKKEDVVELVLPMDVRQVSARPEVKANQDRVALQRGPLVYCVEGVDNKGIAWNVVVPDNATFTIQPQQILDELVIAIQAKLSVAEPAADGQSVQLKPRSVTAIPYYAWANRGNSPMQVWLPRRIRTVTIPE